MPTFMERMRAPMLLGDGFDGSDTAGESDALSRAVSMNELGNFVNLGPRRRNLGGMGRPDDWIKRQAIQRRGLPPGVENVVYDQRPEQFNKEMQLKNREVDAKLAMADAVNSIRQQQADTQAQRADAYEFGIKNPIGRVMSPRGGNLTVVDPRSGRVIDTGVSSGTMSQQDELYQRAEDALNAINARGNVQSDLETQRQGGRVDLANMSRDARMAAIAAQGKNASERQEDAQAFTANRPREQAEALRNRAREVAQDPGLGANIQFDDKGNFVINPDTDDMTRRIITEKIYGPQARDINLGKGSDASGLNQNVTPGASSTVRMVAPDGRILNVPANRVQEMESKGAKRQ